MYNRQHHTILFDINHTIFIRRRGGGEKEKANAEKKNEINYNRIINALLSVNWVANFYKLLKDMDILILMMRIDKM